MPSSLVSVAHSTQRLITSFSHIPDPLHDYLTTRAASLVFITSFCSPGLMNMSPVVLEPPIMNFHHNSLSPLPKMQYSPTVPAHLDSLRGDSASSSLPPASLNRSGSYLSSHSASGFDREPPYDQDSMTSSFEASNNGPLCCANCGIQTTPLWRRDGDGKSICNACGKQALLHSDTHLLSLGRITASHHPRGVCIITSGPRVYNARIPSLL